MPREATGVTPLRLRPMARAGGRRMAAPTIRPIRGIWWLPGSEQRLAGRLTFSPASGATLLLDGDFADLPPRAWTRPALYGESESGTHLTLLDPSWIDRPPPIEGWMPPPSAQTVVTSQVLLRGRHIPTAEDFIVRRADVRLQGLKELSARRYGFYGRALVAFVGGEDGDPRRVPIDVDDGKLTFVHRRVRVAGGRGDDVGVIAEPAEPVPFEPFIRDWLGALQELVIFAARDSTMIEALTVKPTQSLSDLPGSRRSVEVIMALPGLATPPRHNYKRPLVPLAALGPTAPMFIQKWWHLHRQMGRSAMELFGSALSDRLFLENRLLTLMGFAESMHRVLHNEPPITDAEHETYTTAMLSQVPVRAPRDQYKVREHYKVRLKYAAEQSQRQRLKWLLSRASSVFHGASRRPGRPTRLRPRTCEQAGRHAKRIDASGPDRATATNRCLAISRVGAPRGGDSDEPDARPRFG